MVEKPLPPKIAPHAPGQSSVMLVVANAENIAKRIESHLRNAGHPVRAAWVTDLEDIEDALARGTPDLVLCTSGLPDAPLEGVVNLCRRISGDLPVLSLTHHYTHEEAVAALAAGAHDLVSDEDERSLKHLELVCVREFVGHHHLRDLRAIRTRLGDFEARHKQLLDGTQDAVVHIQEGIISHANPAFSTLLGYAKPDDILSLPVMDLVAPEHQPKVKEHLKQLGRGKVDGKPMDCGLLRQDGNIVTIQALMTRGTVDGENFIEMLVRAEAPAPRAAPAPQAGAAATTTIPGRIAFMDALANAAAQPAQQKMHAALFAVVDAYDALEQRLGFRDAEDADLKLADWLRSCLNAATDSVFRASNGEVAMLIQRNTAAEIEPLCARLCAEAPKQIFTTQKNEASLSLSITAYPLGGGEDAGKVSTELVQEARKLSQKGGKQFLVLGPTAKSSAAEREEARKAAQVKRAIEENRLKLAYQSIASLEGDTRQHFDVLVRMVDETGKEMHAGEFIRSAEKFGLMRAIDRWVVARALKVLAKRENAKDASSLFVKISEETLKDAETFAPWLAAQLKERPLKPEELVFEFQETVLQNHIRKGKALVQAMMQMGATVAIEHFGVGNASSQLIEHIPAAFLKFHPSYTHSFADKELVRKMATLMEVAKQKQMKTIVCHVEDANVMARLWQMGVNYIQGYHVQEPEVVLLSTDLFAR